MNCDAAETSTPTELIDFDVLAKNRLGECLSVREVGYGEFGPSIREIFEGALAGRDGDYPRSAYPAGLDIAWAVANEDRCVPVEGNAVPARRTTLGNGDQVGAYGVIRSVRAGFEVDQAAETERAELDLGHAAGVASQDRLQDQPSLGEYFEGLGGSWKGPPPAAHLVGPRLVPGGEHLGELLEQAVARGAVAGAHDRGGTQRRRMDRPGQAA